MPCAEGELCLQQNRTPQDPHDHVCQGGCGGRLHGNCGSVFDDIETHRICSTCVTRIGKRKATAADGAGAGPSERQKDKSGGSKKGGSRARPDNNTKLEILKLLDAKVSGTHVTTGGGEEDEEEGSGDDNTGPERRAPPACIMLSCRRTLASWKQQQMRVATETRRSSKRKRRWR